MSRHRVLLPLMFVMVVLHCVWTAEKAEYPPHSQLIGSWQWVSSVGGIAGHTITPETEGYSLTMMLTETDVYQLCRRDSLTVSGAYSYIHDEGLLIIRTRGRFEYQIALVGDTLKMGIVNVFDGYSHTYVRSR